MSNPDDVAARLSGAVDDAVIAGFGQGPADGQPAVARADWSVDDEPDVDQAMPLPPIVLATEPDSDSEPGPGDSGDFVPVLAPAARVAPSVSASAPLPEAWGGYVTTTANAPAGASLRTPGRRPRVRRVTRVLRHVDPWSTFKVALLFSLVGYLVTMTSGVLLWRVADSTGTLDNVERWFTQFGWETFELKGGEVFHNAWVIGLFGAIALTGGLVLLATLFNLVSDIVGGVRLTVLEEEVVERTVSSTRRYVVRRPPVGGVTPARAVGPEWSTDDDGTDSMPLAGSAGSSSDEATADWSVDDG
jgi:hypothetical protein